MCVIRDVEGIIWRDGKSRRQGDEEPVGFERSAPKLEEMNDWMCMGRKMFSK